MSPTYEPRDHILPIDTVTSIESIIEQREITIRSYQTTIPFDQQALENGLATAWLTPQIRFGVFSKLSATDAAAVNVVLGLQGETTIRAYDYDQRRPLWYSWQNVVVDTIQVH